MLDSRDYTLFIGNISGKIIWILYVVKYPTSIVNPSMFTAHLCQSATLLLLQLLQ